MSRKNKNIIMCIVLTILVISLCFTVYRIKLNISNTPHRMNFDNMERKEMPNNDEGGKFRRRKKEKSEAEGDEKQTEEKNDSKSNNTSNDSFEKRVQPPEMNEEIQNGDFTPPDMFDAENMKKDFSRGNKDMGVLPNKKTNISTFQYILIGIESLGISIIIIYLIMTSFNKKTIKDVVSEKDNIIICVLATIILTFGLIFGSSHIIKTMSINNYSNIKVIDEKEFESKTKEKNTKEDEKSSSKSTSDESSESA